MKQLVKETTFQLHLIFWLVPFLVFGTMLYRIHFGVDFTDESFYLAMARNFSFGAVPFVNEINLIQLSSWLISPLVDLHIVLHPSFDGLMIFMREAYLVFLLLLAMSVYSCLRNILRDRPLALILAVSAAVFVPYNIYFLSYNTMGSGFFVLGVFVLASAVLSERGVWGYALAGVFHALAVLSYPTLVVPLILIYSWLFLREKKAGVRSLIIYGGSASVIALAILLPLMLTAGWENITNTIEYTRSFGSQHFSNIVHMFFGLLHHSYIVVPWFGLVYWMRDRFPVATRAAIILFPLIWLWVGGIGMPHSNWYVVNYALAAPLLYLLFRCPDELARWMLTYIWLPAFVVGMGMAWSSGNGAIAAANGLIAGCVVTSWMLVRLYQQTGTEENAIKPAYLVAPLGFIGVLLFFQFSSVYRDANVFDLNDEVISGPYAGIYTTEAKAGFVARLGSDFQRLKLDTDAEMLSFSDFPAAYLFLNIPSASNTAWLFPPDLPQNNTVRKDLISRFEEKGVYPALIIQLKRIPYDASGWRSYVHPADDPLVMLTQSEIYHRAVLRDEYEIFLHR